jgi:hypothetical protein
MPRMAREEIRWIAQTLQTAVQAFGLSNRELERRLGWHQGAFDDLLEGRVELEPWHVVKILDGMTLEPEEPSSSDDLDLDDRGSFLVDELIGRFERLGYGPAEASIPDHSPPNGPELERRIRAVLREAFGDVVAGEEPAAGDF